MPFNNTLNRSVQVAQQYLRGAPLTGVQGVANEPALTIGDNVRQTILGPPFYWRWNRFTNQFFTVAGTTDYASTITGNNNNGMGWMEKAYAQTNTQTHELEIQLNLSGETVQNQPLAISPIYDSIIGNQIIFRLFPAPEQVYQVTVNLQYAAPSFAALTDTWAPIPDYMYWLYQLGFTAGALEYWNDERAPFYTRMFLQQLVATHGGLTDSQASIFLDQRLSLERTSQTIQNSALARQGRGMYGQQ